MGDLTTRLLDLQCPSSVRISPSGQHVVYVAGTTTTRGDHAQSALWLADTARRHSARALTTGLFHDRAPEWAPDGKSIIFLSDRGRAATTATPSCALWQLHVDGPGEPAPLTPTTAEADIAAFRISPDGQRIAFVSPDEPTPAQRAREKARDDAIVYGQDWPYDRLRLLHLASGFVETLVAEDRHVKPQLAWMSDSARLVFTATATPELDCQGVRFEGIDIHSRNRQHILDFPGWLESADFVYRGNHIFFIAGRDSTSICSANAVWRLELATSKVSILAPKDTACAASLCVVGDRLALHYLDDQMEKLALVGGSSHHIVYENWSSMAAFHARALGNGSLALAFVHGSAAQPDEVYYVQLSDTKRVALDDAVALSNHGVTLPEFAHRHASMLRCDSRDQAFALEGIVMSPSPNPTPRPTVVLVHGGPYFRVNNKWNPGRYYWHEILFSKGYTVLCPNYRGSSGHGERWAAAAHHATGTGDYDDVLSLVQESIRLGHTDPRRVLVGGWSQGGFMSYLCAVRNGHYADGTPAGFRFQATICGAGITDSDMLTMSSDLPTGEAELAGGAPWLLPRSTLSTRQGSAIWEFEAARDIPPALLLHGQADARVPISQAIAYNRACLRRGVPCEFVTYPREPHDMNERAHIADMLARVVTFCERHLGIAGPPPASS